MVDFIKIANTGLTPEQVLQNKILSFTEVFHSDTGEVEAGTCNAKYQGLKFSITAQGKVSLAGSLHKFFNKGEHNYNDFTLNDLIQAIKDLENKFCIDPKQVVLNGIEFGVNIEMLYNPDLFIDALVSQGKNQFNIEKRNRVNYAYIKHAQYTIKIYNKSIQYNLPSNLLRYEVKITRMSKLHKYGIRTLEDLTNRDKLIGIKCLLQEVFNDIVFRDNTVDIHLLSNKEKELLKDGCNPKYWSDYYIEAGSNGSKKLRRYQNLIKTHGKQNFHTIGDIIIQKWDSLLNNEVEKIRDFTDSQVVPLVEKVRDFTDSENKPNCEKVRVFTNSESLSSESKESINTSFYNLSIGENHVNQNTTERKCIITGIDISMQKEGSRFLNKEGVRFLYKNNREIYDKLLSEINPKWHHSALDEQYYRIAHNIRDKFFNPRNQARRSIRKLCAETALFDNALLISEQKKKIANRP